MIILKSIKINKKGPILKPASNTKASRAVVFIIITAVWSTVSIVLIVIDFLGNFQQKKNVFLFFSYKIQLHFNEKLPKASLFDKFL